MKFLFTDMIAMAPENEGAGGTVNIETNEGVAPAAVDSVVDPMKALEDKLRAEYEVKLANDVAGLKRKNEELLGKVQKTSKTSLSDEEYARYAQYQERLQKDDLLRLLADGKSEEVIEKVTARTRADYEAKLSVEAETRAKLVEEAATARRELEQTKVSVAFAREASSRIEPQYLSVVEQMTKNNIKLVEGEVRVVNDDGSLKRDASGNPVQVGDYIESLRSTYTALFKNSSGGGASGSTGGSPKRVVNFKMSQEEIATMSPLEYAKARKEGRI